MNVEKKAAQLLVEEAMKDANPEGNFGVWVFENKKSHVPKREEVTAWFTTKEPAQRLCSALENRDHANGVPRDQRHWGPVGTGYRVVLQSSLGLTLVA